jgi:hypothetical protein
VTVPANKPMSALGVRRGRRIHLGGSLAAAILLASLSGGPALSQRPVTIKAPPVVIAEAAGQVAFPIHIEPAEAIPRNSFVRLRGLPPMAALSEGYVIGAGSWAVPIAALADLKISLPVAATGRADVTILLVAVDGAVLGETKTALTVATAQAAPPGEPRCCAPGSPSTLAHPARTPPRRRRPSCRARYPKTGNGQRG